MITEAPQCSMVTLAHFHLSLVAKNLEAIMLPRKRPEIFGLLPMVGLGGCTHASCVPLLFPTENLTRCSIKMGAHRKSLITKFLMRNAHI